MSKSKRSSPRRKSEQTPATIDVSEAPHNRASRTLPDESVQRFAASIVESLHTPILVLRGGVEIRFANRAFLEAYRVQRADVERQLLSSIGRNEWDVPVLQAALERVTKGDSTFEHLEFEQHLAGQGGRNIFVHIRTLETGGGKHILMTAEDVTDRRRAEHEAFKDQQTLKHTAAVSASELERTARSLQSEALGRTEAEAALHETEAALLHSREELRALAASLFDTQEEERRRVSRELHDDLSQKMAKLQFDLETLEQHLPLNLDRLRSRLLTIRDEVAALSNDLRRLAHQLHPSTLDHLGLSVALRSFTREFAEREALQVEFTARNVPKRIPPEIATSLYRVVQEALRNVAKHAPKAAATVTLAGSSAELCLTIRDRGPGFDFKAIQGKGGLGLISMQERVRLVRGDFSLKARPGRGVVITIRVPLS